MAEKKGESRRLATSLGSGSLVRGKLVELGLEGLDGSVSRLKILVEPVSLGDELSKGVKAYESVSVCSGPVVAFAQPSPS